jgi:N6-adenosine-specific RNA methylase IME4/ParB-like chromosome segregation protein Spo0J
MSNVGLLHPIVITTNGELVAGAHRLAAAQLLGWKLIEVRKVKLKDLTRELAEIDENLLHRQLTAGEKSLQTKRRKEIYEALHPETTHGGDRKSNQVDKSSTRSFADDTADKTGESARTIRRDVQIGAFLQTLPSALLRAVLAHSLGDAKDDLLKIARIKAPDERLEVIELFLAGTIKSFSDYVKRKRTKKLAQIAKGNAPIEKIAERFPILYADPPWRYSATRTIARQIENQYPTMSDEEICALKLSEICTDDAILFLWVTAPKLETAVDALRAWGFKYKTCAVWDKEVMGMGNYFRTQHELLFVATRGEPPTPIPRDIRSVLRIKKSSKHSQKPAEMAEIIERMYPDLPKIELFCREPRKGWAAWGNQSEAAE